MRHPALWAAAGLALAVMTSCKRQIPAVGSLPYANDFEGPLGPEWYASGGHWIVQGGSLLSNGANNAPLFLQIDLPADVVVEFDAKSETPAVDTKAELMTDGRRHQSGYVFFLGGWSNSKSIIARLDEHGPEGSAVISKRPTAAVADRWYRWRIEKRGGTLRWFLDDNLYLTFDDPEPLSGAFHNRFAFGNWQNRVRFDNLRVRELGSVEAEALRRASEPSVAPTPTPTAAVPPVEASGSSAATEPINVPVAPGSPAPAARASPDRTQP